MFPATPALDQIAVCHKHRWSLLTEASFSREWPNDVDDVIIAVCACGERMTKEQAEAILNHLI